MEKEERKKNIMQACRRLQEGNSKGTSGDDHLTSEGGQSGSTSVSGRGRGAGSVDLSDVASGRGDGTRGSTGSSLDLAVRDLSDGSLAGGGLADSGLDLAVGDLGDGSLADTSGSLDLAVGDLSDGSTASGSLDLTVRDLGDDLRLASRGLDLAIGDLGNLGGRGGGLDLTVGDLRDSRGRSGSDLAISSTADGGARANDVDVDLRALVAGGLVVKVVEGTAQALVEDGRVTKGKSAVAADRPARGVDGTSLGRLVELELVVGGDVASAALVVSQDTVGEGHGEDLALREVTLGGGAGDVNNRDGELAIVRGLAASWGALLRGNGRSDTLRCGGSKASKGGGNSKNLHCDNSR